jgi:DNA polymerase III delta subunit
MIIFIHGENTEKARNKAHELIDSLRKKKPDASFFKINSENWNEGLITEYAMGQGLFSNKYIVFLDKICENKDLKDSFIDKLDEMKSSENVFIILEGKLDKITITKIEKRSDKVQLFELIEKTYKKEDFNIFSLGEALGNRDKKNLWILYRSALNNGKVPEEIHGTLFWQLKSIAIASKTDSATNSGLSPFVFSKSKNYLKNFKQQEIFNMLNTLISISHDSRRGIGEIETSLERWILEAF